MALAQAPSRRAHANGDQACGLPAVRLEAMAAETIARQKFGRDLRGRLEPLHNMLIRGVGATDPGTREASASAPAELCGGDSQLSAQSQRVVLKPSSIFPRGPSHRHGNSPSLLSERLTNTDEMDRFKGAAQPSTRLGISKLAGGLPRRTQDYWSHHVVWTLNSAISHEFPSNSATHGHRDSSDHCSTD
jgi:hypothetical protein